MGSPTKTSHDRLGDHAVFLFDALPAAVLVVNVNGTIQWRNAPAEQWLLDGTNLDAVLAQLRFLQPFNGWSTELNRILETGTTACWDGVLSRVNAPSPVMVSASALTMLFVPS